MTFAILLLGLIPGILKGIPGISATIQAIIADVAGSVGAILGSGVVTQPSVNTALAAWVGVIAVIKADPNFPASSLNALLQAEKAVQAALLQDAKAAQAVDWSSVEAIEAKP